MKEDKENTCPREKRVEIKCEENEKSERPNKEKKEAMTKIVIRRLPPSLTKEELEEQLQPLPDVDYLEFFSSDTSLYPHLFARAYLNFKNQDDIVLFRDRFDGYVFIDNRGQEYPAIVEFAPFQKIAKKKSKKKDAKIGTIDEDADYKRFLELYNGDDEKLSSTPETLLEEIEAKSKELFAKKTTPLLDFLKNKQRIREEKKEERRRRELERKRLRDEERRKWREEDRRKRKEAEKLKKAEKAPDKDRDQPKEDQPKIKLLKKPEKKENCDTEKPKEKPKKQDRDKLKDDRVPAGDTRKRQNGEHKEDKTKRFEEDGQKDHRERDVDRERDRERERERERRQKEKERLRRQDEERRRRRERQDGENTYKRREDEGKREKEYVWEKKKNENTAVSSGHAQTDKFEKPSKDGKKEDSVRKDRLRNKDRPAIQLYQPGARNRNRGAGARDGQEGEKKAEKDVKNTQEKGEE